jgi:hypothetical protein
MVGNTRPPAITGYGEAAIALDATVANLAGDAEDAPPMATWDVLGAAEIGSFD